MTPTILKTAAFALSAALFGLAGEGSYAFQAPEQPTAVPSLAPSDASVPGEKPSATGEADPAPGRVGDTPAIPELAARYEIARAKLVRLTELHKTGAVTTSAFAVAEGEVRGLEAQIAGQIQQLEEELELLGVRMSARKADLRRAEAQVQFAMSNIAMMRRLNERNQGVVVPEEIAKVEAEARQAEAGRDVRAAESQEVEVRARQVRRRLSALTPLLKGSDRNSEALPAPPESVSLMQTLSGWMYPDSKMPHGASMSDGGNPRIQSIKCKAILTTPDSVEKVIEFYAKMLSEPSDPDVKDADARSVTNQDDSKERPVTVRVFVVNTLGTSTTLVVSRAEGEKETHIAWTHYLRIRVKP